MKRVGAPQQGKVIAIDLLPVEPIAGVDFAQIDFLDADAPDKLKAMMGGPADVVLSDMAANATGHRKTDHLKIMALVELAAEFAREVLAPGGSFLAKVLQGGTEVHAAGEPQARLPDREAHQAGGEPPGFLRALPAGHRISKGQLAHDPEKWEPVFG